MQDKNSPHPGRAGRASGHRESGPPVLPLSSAMSGAAMLAVLDAFGLEGAAVLGCSRGGIAGLQAAFQAPDRISAVAAFPGRAPRALQAAARAVLIERESLLPLLPKLEVPVLVVSGAEDTRYPPAETQEIARRIPGARFLTVEDSAHLTPLEQPEITARLVRELVAPTEKAAASGR